jgi:hypothetical protein
VSKLAIDEFRLGSAGGKTDWRSPDYEQVAGRYDVEIGAGASEVTIRSSEQVDRLTFSGQTAGSPCGAGLPVYPVPEWLLDARSPDAMREPSVRNRNNQHEQDDRGCHPSVEGGREQHERRNKEEEHDTEPE